MVKSPQYTIRKLDSLNGRLGQEAHFTCTNFLFRGRDTAMRLVPRSCVRKRQRRSLLPASLINVLSAHYIDLFTEVITGGDVAVYGPFWRSVMVAGLYGGEIYVAELNGTIIATAVWFGPGRALYDSCVFSPLDFTFCSWFQLGMSSWRKRGQ